MKTISVITAGRSDYGIYQSTLNAIQASVDLKLELYVTGQHLSPEFGLTIQQIEQDSYPIVDRIEILLSADTPHAIAKSMGLGLLGFSQSFAMKRPEILLVLGDRFEMMSAVLAALPFGIPVAHIHGGELTQGAFDDQLRHCLTKLSDIHFVTTETYRNRVIQLGEDPKNVITVGAPSLDTLKHMKFYQLGELNNVFQIQLPDDFALCTYHPVTTNYTSTPQDFEEVLSGLNKLCKPILFTMPNADTSGRIIRAMIHDYCEQNSDCFAIESLGTRGYFSAMKHASLMVGNSSSGILEAGALHLPVVNIGTRQQGRVQGQNVINCKTDGEEIYRACLQALSDKFNSSLKGMSHPYGSGQAAQAIVQTLRETDFTQLPQAKKFYDLPDISNIQDKVT